MAATEITITTGAIRSYQKGVSTCLPYITEALDAALAHLQASEDETATIVVTVVRHDKVYTEEQSAALRADYLRTKAP
jgi:hypothetical protein